MKILFYCISQLNEASYSVYYLNALIKLGYDVDSLFDKEVFNEYARKGNDIAFWMKYDLIIFMGFSFGNFCTHQGFDRFMPDEAGVPYAVLYFDMPARYGNALKHLKDTDYHFFLCDSKETVDMQKLGYKNSYFAPCCFDPDIQKPGPVNPKMEYPVCFPGTFLDPKSIYDKQQGIRAGLNFFEQRLLDEFHTLRTKGQYFDYHDYLISNGIHPDNAEYGKLAFPLIMMQKYLLRVELFQNVIDLGLDMHIFGKGNFKSSSSNLVMHENLNQLTELPILYRSAKIITSIELHNSSCHQRIMDACGNEGFILGEGKSDESYCFRDIIQWADSRDLNRKIKYFLKNDKARRKIAKSMREEGLARHTNIIRMREILDVIGI